MTSNRNVRHYRRLAREATNVAVPRVNGERVCRNCGSPIQLQIIPGQSAYYVHTWDASPQCYGDAS